MSKFRVNCSWTETGVIEVEADTAEEAKEKADNHDLPEGEYLKHSFSIDGVDAA